jgi:hypothetical protein
MALIDRLQRELQRQPLVTNTKKARKWIRDKVKELENLRPELLMRDTKRKRNTFQLGKMYFFNYNPKWKDILPFYDIFPLVIPIDFYSDGFLGLNLHYLSPTVRAKLLDKLSEYATDNRFDEKTRLMVTYSMLKSASGLEAFKPCLKRYLTKHVTSKFLMIDATEWDIAIFLPVESFIGATKTKVYRDSTKKYQ